jgi:pyrimidine-nucleoside phosphorylase
MQRIVDIIAAKRDGLELEPEDIQRMVLGYSSDEIPDYQMSAFLMSVYLKGMSPAETYALTESMVHSGEVIDLSAISGIKVDKHSTGGVGDKTTLIVVPILAALGLIVPKMSGRGLGFTGGTLDKLESIPGYRTKLTPDEILAQLQSVGAVIAGQSEKIATADRKMYALRDVTGTVDSIPLIASSIMSKKIACGADVILLDVKFGNGAFMTDIENARELANAMIDIGNRFGRHTAAVLSDMDQPLGQAVGNSLEVKEAIETLHGAGPKDLRDLSALLAGVILEQSGMVNSVDDGIVRALQVIDSGAALKKLEEIISAQGGDPAVCNNPDILPKAPFIETLISSRSGYIHKIDCKSVGIASSLLGAGREHKEDAIDHSAGLVLQVNVGDAVESGQILAHLYSQNMKKLQAGKQRLLDALMVSDTPGYCTNVSEIMK